MTIITALIGEFWPYILGAMGVAAAFLSGRQSGKTSHIKRKAKADAKAHDRINNLEPVDPADRSDIADRLRRHSE